MPFESYSVQGSLGVTPLFPTGLVANRVLVVGKTASLDLESVCEKPSPRKEDLLLGKIRSHIGAIVAAPKSCSDFLVKQNTPKVFRRDLLYLFPSVDRVTLGPA